MKTLVSLDQLQNYDVLIDARTPAEFTEDHIPGAINLPVLNDDERARVGTVYQQESPFVAKKLGAALVARNIATHLETHFLALAKDYRPLVYCWRGGNRSGAMVTILRAVGWNAHQLEGGYKAFRRRVIDALATLPQAFHFKVISGATGVGKSRCLQALAAQGAQVLDLEALAAHKGSVLGLDLAQPQPSQKQFETAIWDQLRQFDVHRPVFVEAESKRIGMLHVPDALMQQMRQSPCLEIQADPPVRVAFLLDDYAYFLNQPERLCAQLACLTEIQGHARVTTWQALAREGAWSSLVASLLDEHYDPAYRRSLDKNYTQVEAHFHLAGSTDADFAGLARQILSGLEG